MRDVMKIVFSIFAIMSIAACTNILPTVTVPPGASETLLPATSEVTSSNPTDQAAYPPASTPSPLPSPSLFPSPSPSPLPSPTQPSTPQPPPNLQVTQLKMFDEQSGWAVHQIYYPEDYKILRTTTGAASWKDVSPPAPAAQYSLDEVFFTDANTAIILVRKIPSVQTYDVEITPWRTTDGGQTWQAGEIIHTDRSIMAAIRGVEMIDAEHGWMLTEEDGAMQTAALHFFKTRDGGLHWDRIYSSVDHIGDPNILWGGGYSQFTKQFTFVTETLGFYEGSAITQDGGRSWSPITFELPGDLPEIDCHPGRIPCKFYRTRSLPQFTSSQDGVSLLRVYPNSEDVRDAFLYGDSSPLPLPAAQYVYYTHDGGQNWSITSAPALMGLLYFFDGQTGWFLGKDDPDPATLTQLYQTVDGGETWVKIVSDCPLLLGSHLQFVDAQNGFASGSPIPLSAYRNLDMRAGATHSIFITKDGGDTWQQVEPQLEP